MKTMGQQPQHRIGTQLSRGQTAAAPSPNVPEGWDGSPGCGTNVPNGAPPTPDRSPQGGAENNGLANATFAANRAHGRVSLGLAARAGKTYRTTLREDGSLRVRFPSACSGVPEAVLVNT